MSGGLDDKIVDPWLLSTGTSGTATSPLRPFPSPSIVTIRDVTPLDNQIGASPKKTVPDALYPALFGQRAPDASVREDPENLRKLHTYAILDAARVTNLPELLERSSLQHRCLFKDKAYDDLNNVAPWIVRLEENNSFTRNLFTRSDAPRHLWDTKPGLYVRSDATLDDMYRHFRKFTRIQDEDEKWHFLAFWSHPIGVRLFLNGDHMAIAPIVRRILTLPQHRLMVVVASEDGCAVVEAPQDEVHVKPRWLLTRPAWELIRQLRREQQFDELVQITWRHAARHLTVSETEFGDGLRNKRDLWFRIGFWRRDHLAKLCSWEALLGPHFLESYGNGAVIDILRSARSPHNAIAQIDQLLDSQSSRKATGA